MATERLEVRLDQERRRKLDELARAQGVPVSEAVRSLIDQAYEGVLLRERRRQAAQTLARLEVEEVPEPDELSRQLDGTYEPTGLP